MKTISDLNKSWWYRLLKVLFFCGFLVVGGVSAWKVYTANKTILEPDLRITCNYGNQSTFNARHDKGISIAAYDPYKQMPDSMNTQILNACSITQAEIAARDATEAAASKSEESCPRLSFGRFTSYIPDCSGIKTVAHPSPLYDSPDVSIPVDDTGKAIGYAVLDIVLVAFLFEVLRRIFYYVATGKIRPVR